MRFLAITILTFLAISDLPASPSGKIALRVFDASSRSPLAGANVVITGTEIGGAADQNGTLILRDVPAGVYSVEISMIGYRTQVKTHVAVQPGRSAELEVRLERSPVAMGAVEVRPDYFPKSGDAAVSSTNFSSAEIRVQPGGTMDIQRVVQALPSVSGGNDQDNEVIVRGGSQGENLFILDGVEVPYPNHFGLYDHQGGAINLINPLMIREADFIAGAFPARYGDKASSVMDVSLKRGSREGLDGNVDMGVGGVGAIIEVPLLRGKGSFMAAYHRSFLDFMSAIGLFPEDAILPFYTNYMAKLSVDITPRNELSLMAIAGSDDLDVDMEGFLNGMTGTLHLATSRLVSGLGLRSLFGERSWGRLSISYSRARWGQYLYTDSLDTLNSTTSTLDSWKAQYQLSLGTFEGFPFEAGAFVKYEPSEYSFYTPLTDTTFLDIGEDTAGLKAGGWIEQQFSLWDVADIELGARADYFDLVHELAFSPRVRISTRPLLWDVSVHAGYGWHYQTPAYFLLLNDTANYALRSERSDHYIAGIERLITDDTKLSVEGYFKNITNLPLTEPLDPRGALVAQVNSQAWGVEFLIQKRYAHNWHGTLGYSYSSSVMQNPLDKAVLVPGDYDYRHMLSVVAAYKFEFYKYEWYLRLPEWFRMSVGSFLFSDESNLGFRFRYMGPRPYTPMQWNSHDSTWSYDADDYNSVRYPAYHRLDVRWDHKFLFKGWSMSWYIEAQNAYGRKNVWQCMYMPGGVVDTLYQMALLPSGGMVIEF
ncbi:TonB-dependent receptor [bacterium]|nr:TonB-dependent receptor [bacterium]